MENRIYGIITIGIAIVLYYLAYKKFLKENYKLCLWLIMLGGLLLRLFTSMDFYLHEWDERYHALVSKNLIQNPLKPMLYSMPILDYDYRNWTSNHIWLHKQPFPLYSMALSMFILGKNTIALRLPSILLSTASIFATFQIGKILVSKKIGIFAAFLFSINGLIIESTAGRVATDHIDVFFYSLTTIAIYYLLRSVDQNSRNSIVLGAIFTGLAILSKWLPALIVLPVWLIYYYQKQGIKGITTNLTIFITVCSAIAIPWQIYIMNQFPMEASWEYEYNSRHFFEVIEEHTKPIYYHFDRMRIIYGELIYIPLLWLIFTTYSQLRKSKYTKLILASWILIPYLFFSVALSKMQGYILFCSTAIFIMTAMFFYELKSFETKFKKLKLLTLILLIALPIRYSVERISPFSIKERNPDWITEMRKLRVKENKSVVFNCKYPIETMFHTNLIAYETTPNMEKLKFLKTEGYDIYIDNHKSINEELTKLNFVNYIEITGHNNR